AAPTCLLFASFATFCSSGPAELRHCEVRMSTPTASWPQLDVIAVGAHPDDVEIACGGTLAKLVKQGYSVGIIDLTDGEPTPESPGPEVRLAEAKQAAEILGAAVRVTLDLPNRHPQVRPENF